MINIICKTFFQLLVIGSQSTQFAVKQVQTNYIIFASTLGFSIIWQVNGQVKIKVPTYIKKYIL